MATLRMQKIVYDGLDDLQEITADTMAKWFRAYGKVAGSIDIGKMASPVAERLASLGVMTVGDLRHVTADVYEERCDLTCIAAIRLHKHFGMVPEVPVNLTVGFTVSRLFIATDYKSKRPFRRLWVEASSTSPLLAQLQDLWME